METTTTTTISQESNLTQTKIIISQQNGGVTEVTIKSNNTKEVAVGEANTNNTKGEPNENVRLVPADPEPMDVDVE